MPSSLHKVIEVKSYIQLFTGRDWLKYITEIQVVSTVPCDATSGLYCSYLLIPGLFAFDLIIKLGYTCMKVRWKERFSTVYKKISPTLLVQYKGNLVVCSESQITSVYTLSQAHPQQKSSSYCPLLILLFNLFQFFAWLFSVILPVYHFYTLHF